MVMFMKNMSIWKEFKEKNSCPKLEKDLEVDVLVIGGGITGMSTIYHLINSGLKVCLIEKNTIASGVTSKTTGKITYLQENIYSKLKKYHSFDTAKLYLESQIDAINIIKEIVEKNQIKCDLKNVSSYIVNNSNEKFKEEISILKQFNIDIKETSFLPNKDEVKKAFYVEDTYVFHPLKYLYALKEICLKSGIQIYENTKITAINKENNHYICKTSNNHIKTKYVVLALHYPYFLMPFWMPLKAYIEQSYIKATPVNQDYNFSSITITKPIKSIRYQRDNNETYEICLTNSHNTCTKNNDKENFRELLSLCRTKPNYLWSNKDIMTHDSLPFIGSINSDGTLIIGTGYNTWGMTNGSLAGKIISDIILKKNNKYIKLFNPQRKMNVGKILNFPLILGSNAYSFIKSKLTKQKSWYPENVRFEKRNGRNVAIYKDEFNKEHVVYNTCPHMKCSLMFNEIEKTWDCPCHGSRFDIDGNSIEGPSNYDITYKE